MAIQNIPQKTTLGIKLQTGLNAAGNPIYKTLSFSSVKPAATDENVYAVGLGLAGLQKYPPVGIARTNSSNLISV